MADIRNVGMKLIFDLSFFDLLDKTRSEFWTGEFFFEKGKTKSIMDALILNAAQKFVTFQNQDVTDALVIGGNRSRHAGRSTTDNH